jgi:multicomponent Na+:H+ antiporter subunit E
MSEPGFSQGIQSRRALMRRVVPGLLVRAVLLLLVWIVLTGGSLAYWGLAALIIAAATATSLAVMPPGEWRWTALGLARFLPYFACQSVLGGIDVSRRAFLPSMPLQPGFITYPLRLPDGPERVFFANSVNLQPGTAIVGIDGDVLTVHALDVSMPIHGALAELERRVADLFGVELLSSAAEDSPGKPAERHC